MTSNAPASPASRSNNGRAFRLSRVPLSGQIIAAMLAGAIIGLIAGPRASPLGEFGRVIIQLIKGFAAPLLFFAVVDAFIRTQIRPRSALIMFMIGAINAGFALVIGLGISNLVKPGKSLATGLAPSAANFAAMAGAAHRIDFVHSITGLVPSSVVQPFVENAVLSIIVLAVLAGLALRKMKNESTGPFAPEALIASGLRATEIILGWIVSCVPIAVFGVVAMTVGKQGFAPFKGLALYVAVALLGLGLQIMLVYQGWLYFTGGRKAVKAFWQGSRDAIVYVIGASSSLATLPVTLRCLDEMKVSTPSARLAACVGSNFNHDGIILYEAMAVLFVAQAHGLHLSLGQQALASVSCLVAAVGIAGIPDAGLISLALVLGTVGLPVQLLPLLLTVDWVLSRARALTNVLSDIVMAKLLDHFENAI